MATFIELCTDPRAIMRQRRLDAMKLQEIESNPLSAEDVAMFEMFERENWPSERREAHIEQLIGDLRPR